jgi:hypothetical protein
MRKMWCSGSISGSAFVLASALAVATALVSAEGLQDPKDDQLQGESFQRSAQARRIEGVWDVTVVIRDCQTGGALRTVRARNMFIRGGTLSELGAQTNPILRGPGLGTWRYVGEDQYTAVFRFTRFNPDGTFSAIQKVSRRITLGQDSNTFAAGAVVELFDLDGNPTAPPGCATETASRLE